MPTQDEIVTRIEQRKADDILGFEWMEYIPFLDYDHAKPYLKAEVTADQWKYTSPFRESIIAEMFSYMEFAWGKANDCRGISANRSIMHYIAWTWLAGDTELSDFLDVEFSQNYEYYGKPLLKVICDKYSWNWRQWDDDCWRNGEDENCLTADEALSGKGR